MIGLKFEVRKQWFRREFEEHVVRTMGFRALDSALDIANEMEDQVSVIGVPWFRRSLPGEPPRIESGDLLKSFHVIADNQYGSRPRVRAIIYSDVEYAAYLEVGFVNNRTGRPVAPRPYIIPSMIAVQSIIRAKLMAPLPMPFVRWW